MSVDECTSKSNKLTEYIVCLELYKKETLVIYQVGIFEHSQETYKGPSPHIQQHKWLAVHLNGGC